MTFIGRIPEKEELEKVKGDQRISYYEHVSKRDLHEKIFPATDIFLLPTRAEAYGMSIFEAMSYGIPVVSSNISAIPEVVEDGFSGYLSSPESIESLTRRCAELVGNREKRERMGENATTKVERDYSPAKIGRELYKLYMDCLS